MMQADAVDTGRLSLLMALRRAGIRDQSVLRAMEMVPSDIVSADNASLPAEMIASCLQTLDISSRHVVLHIGLMDGYIAALLAQLARRVITVMRDDAYYHTARQRFAAEDYVNITPVCADGLQGWADSAPYDRIIVSAAVRAIPSDLLAQLRDGGCMLIAVGEPHAQKLLMVQKSGWNYTRTVVENITCSAYLD